MKSKFLTSTEAAALVGCDRASIKNWANRGLIEGAWRTPGGHWRFTLEGVTKFREVLEFQVTEPQADIVLGTQVIHDHAAGE